MMIRLHPRSPSHMASKSFAIALSLMISITPFRSPNATDFSEQHPYANLDFTDCEEIWNLLWADFLDGHQDASATIASLIMFRGLRLPRHESDLPLVLRDLVFFAMHAIDNSELDHDFIQSFQLDFLPFYWEMHSEDFFKYEDCISDDDLARECIEIAVDLRVIPSLDEFISGLEAAINTGARAYCDDAAMPNQDAIPPMR